MHMKQVLVTTRAEWRRWLARHHRKEKDGIWLVFFKDHTGHPSLGYEESVEEALCFGWVDSLIKRIDDARYCRKFTPRKEDSNWSHLNQRRVEKVIKEGRMTEFGLAKIETAKGAGTWQPRARPVVDLAVPREFSQALARNAKANAFFETLAPCHQRHFIGWIVLAKKPETRARRVKESLRLLARGEKLGLK
jgi:uncharacterized protein YdeI (YjbR/CyaY-like superfamily)